MNHHRVTGQQARSQKTRETILAAARDLFAERGFDGVSVEAIAQAAGIAKGSVLAHFSEKLGILAAYFDDSLNLAIVSIKVAPRPLRGDVLAALLWPLVNQLASDPAYLRLMTTVPGDAAHKDLRPALLALEQSLSTALHETGTDHADIAAEMVRAVLVHLAVDTRARIDLEGKTVALIAARRKLDSFLAFALRDPL